MDHVGHTCKVLNDAIVVRRLYNNACNATFCEFCLKVVFVGNAIGFTNSDDVNAMEVGVCIDNTSHLRVNGRADQHLVGFLGCGESHDDSFGRGCGAIVHGSV